MDLTNGSAIVTGGASSFGSATVRRLAQKGAKVVIADVSDERGKALAREVGAGSLYVPTNCMDEDAVAKAVKAAAGLGKISGANTAPAKTSFLRRWVNRRQKVLDRGCLGLSQVRLSVRTLTGEEDIQAMRGARKGLQRRGDAHSVLRGRGRGRGDQRVGRWRGLDNVPPCWPWLYPRWSPTPRVLSPCCPLIRLPCGVPAAS